MNTYVGQAEGHHGGCIALAKEIHNTAIKEIDRPKKTNYFIVTNIPYVVRQKPQCVIMVDEISRAAGVSQFKGNLVILQDSPFKTPFIYFFNPTNQKAIYIEIDKDLNGIKSKKIKTDINKFFTNDAEFETLKKDKSFSGNEYRLLMITSIWSKGLLRSDLVYAVMLHNHYCPGVTSGYHIASFILKNFPLTEGQGYVFIASPMWCKDDAIQVMLDTTPG
ncbi:MAG: FmdE family protein, partial [Thermodesulfovibrionales bacterium]